MRIKCVAVAAFIGVLWTGSGNVAVAATQVDGLSTIEKTIVDTVDEILKEQKMDQLNPTEAQGVVEMIRKSQASITMMLAAAVLISLFLFVHAVGTGNKKWILITIGWTTLLSMTGPNLLVYTENPGKAFVLQAAQAAPMFLYVFYHVGSKQMWLKYIILAIGIGVNVSSFFLSRDVAIFTQQLLADRGFGP